MDSGAFDVVILSTGLKESILAAALSKAGLKVAHIDTNAYYGASDASLNLDEFQQWLGNLSGNIPQVNIPESRQYSISLSPSVITSTGPLISALIASGVHRYTGFRLVDRVAIHLKDQLRSVPASKEDIFKDKSIKLIDKRRIMRFLLFASGDFESSPELQRVDPQIPFTHFLKDVFSLNDDLVDAVTYALAYCFSPSDPTLPSLTRIRSYLRSSGRYGPSPFLIAQYGSSGELAQGFCRAAAVAGAVYILARPITSISRDAGGKHTIQLDDFPEPLTCHLIVGQSPSTDPPVPVEGYGVVKCVAIVDQPVSFDVEVEGEGEGEEKKPADAGIIVFPPSSPTSTAVTVLITGEATLSVPHGKWIIYISQPIPTTNPDPDPTALLHPYLTKLLSPSHEPIFKAFYYTPPPSPPPSPSPVSMTMTTPPPLPLPSSPDESAKSAEHTFWDVVAFFREKKKDDGWDVDGFWPASTTAEEEEAEE